LQSRRHLRSKEVIVLELANELLSVGAFQRHHPAGGFLSARKEVAKQCQEVFLIAHWNKYDRGARLSGITNHDERANASRLVNALQPLAAGKLINETVDEISRLWVLD